MHIMLSQGFQTIVDSAGDSAASAADSSQVSTMSSWDDGFAVVVAGFHGRCLGSGNGPLRGSDSRNDSPLVFNSMRWL
jgi:hypothetical protein